MASYAGPARPPGTNGNAREFDRWRDSTRVFLQPIAAPSILGLFGFAAATFMVATNLAGWYGSPTSSPTYLFPFAAVFGGIAQFAAGMWAYRARDAVATAMHGMWGSFWVAYGILWLLATVHALTLPTGRFPALAFWFFPLAAITASGAVAATRKNLGLTATLTALAGGSGCLAIGYLIGSSAWLHTGGWILFAAAVCAFYTATAMMWAASLGRTILPLGEWNAEANVPGHHPILPIEFHEGEPGVRQGQ
ncbi:MAG TPA: GPR1/FUN34/YaaH family transporter [Solirubrobacteraceae bacterium]|nr:GPR1/FUN34/YaaH family transporter [Solirubrobacteraceae bacterium]